MPRPVVQRGIKMYGTRKQLTRKLKKMFVAEEMLALHFWTVESVKSLGESHGITETEAETMLTVIGNIAMYEYQRTGIPEDTFNNFLTSIRKEKKLVNVPADLLESVLASAEDGLDIEKNISRDDNEPLQDNVIRAIENVKRVRRLLEV